MMELLTAHSVERYQNHLRVFIDPAFCIKIRLYALPMVKSSQLFDDFSGWKDINIVLLVGTPWFPLR